MLDLDFELVMSGGLFSGGDRALVDALESRVRSEAPKVRLVRIDVPPACGAALLAMEMLEVPTGPELHAKLNDGARRALAGRP
jgi:hypothetical protein